MFHKNFFPPKCSSEWKNPPPSFTMLLVSFPQGLILEASASTHKDKLHFFQYIIS